MPSGIYFKAAILRKRSVEAMPLQCPVYGTAVLTIAVVLCINGIIQKSRWASDARKWSLQPWELQLDVTIASKRWRMRRQGSLKLWGNFSVRSRSGHRKAPSAFVAARS